MKKRDNYEKALENAGAYFRKRMADPWEKRPFIDFTDGSFRFMFAAHECRVERESGAVWLVQRDGSVCPAGFNAALTAYDLLCDSRPDARLSGQFVSVGSLNPVFNSGEGNAFFAGHAAMYDSRQGLLEQSCRALGGMKVPFKGDLAYELPLFGFMPVVMQFWASDEEFPAALSLLWDKNVLQYLHFETLFYAASELLRRLGEEAAAIRSKEN